MMQLDVAKTAFYQVESMEEGRQTDAKSHDEGYFDDEESTSEEEEKTNSRDVGHNIYILAHQVCCLYLSAGFTNSSFNPRCDVSQQITNFG